MSIDISKSQTKTQINLSKPFHSGPLLINLKPNSSKSLIDIKPIRKVNISPNLQVDSKFTNTNDQPQEIVNKPENIDYFANQEAKPATLDFDKFHQFEDHLNPFLQTDNLNLNRNPSQIRIQDQSTKTFTNDHPQIQQKIDTVVIGDIKKMETEGSKILFSKWQPKIKVAPLHSRSRALTLTTENQTLIQKIKQKYQNSIKQNLAGIYKSDLENFDINSTKSGSSNDFDDNLFQFKAPQKFGASDIPQFANQVNSNLDSSNADRVNLSNLNSELHNSALRKKIRRNNKLKRYSTSTLFTTIIIIFCTLFLTGNAQWMGKFGQRNVQANKNSNAKTLKFEKWIADNNAGLYSAPGNDLDKDGLNNYEEFLINSNPNNPNSCNTSVSDNQNLLNLIDPVSCTPINFDLPGQVQRFENVLNLTPEFIQKHQSQKVQNQSFEAPVPQVINSVISVSVSSATVVTDILPIPNIEVDKVTSPTFIEASVKIKLPDLATTNSQDTISVSSVVAPVIEKAPEVVEPELIAPKVNFNPSAVQQYIDQYRSYDKYDKQSANPVNADYFIDMASRYNVPMKYVLALARSESRFGTDQFNQDGSSNRIGRHLNMYSIGLDDEGGSITYPSWESGVDAFGRWYSRHENRGISDCAKWRIYNPNGDYCQKIENLAGQIENYIAN